MSGVGHNSGNARQEIGEFRKRVVALMEERDGLNADIREIYAEAKAKGYDPKVLRKVVARARRSREDVEAEDSLVDLYEGFFE